MRKGFSMFMCGPNERRVIRALQGSWGRQETDMLEMNIELSMLDKPKARGARAQDRLGAPQSEGGPRQELDEGGGGGDSTRTLSAMTRTTRAGR
ncbi:hypothetical protein FIBSPDRAFT_465209 [Athelia psychrophila]|uniref:Uncharacterized protein n=1 Tax=Athelia psychrophila TaxID=1759441 RepID=A0A166LI42_9AGAM|nr:hypothetical protein FIBSPDRAFT_465209 [Fibularhizoctonia sp. CBS 109695]